MFSLQFYRKTSCYFSSALDSAIMYFKLWGRSNGLPASLRVTMDTKQSPPPSTGWMSNHKSHLTIIAVCGWCRSSANMCVCVRACSVFPFRIKACCESHHGKAAVGAWGKLLWNWAWCLIEAFRAVIERVVFVRSGYFAVTINNQGSDEVCAVAQARNSKSVPIKNTASYVAHSIVYVDIYGTASTVARCVIVLHNVAAFCCFPPSLCFACKSNICLFVKCYKIWCNDGDKSEM